MWEVVAASLLDRSHPPHTHTHTHTHTVLAYSFPAIIHEETINEPHLPFQFL